MRHLVRRYQNCLSENSNGENIYNSINRSTLSMNNTGQRKATLFTRNEGKLKSHDSCFDLRAWSHDMSLRDQYLREWMKCTMPICVFPLSTINNLLSSMNRKHFGRLAPRCQPECKSKKLLETICGSCQAMKDSLKSHENLEKYFEEEDLETGHWPCDKCLSALKSIKMFWKIILDKILKIYFPKTEIITKDHTDSVNYVHNVSKEWQREILEQATYVKQVIPMINSSVFEDGKLSTVDESKNVVLITCNNRCKCTRKTSVIKVCEYAATSTAKLSETGCDPHYISCTKEIGITSSYIQTLEGQLHVHNIEVERLKKENVSLKSKLREVCKKCPGIAYDQPAIFKPMSDINSVLKPFEASSEEALDNISEKDNNSEVIITVKNYKNEEFKHVCMLQVVQKGNKPPEEFTTEESDSQKRDPILLLTKVQNTFGKIVENEIKIANRRNSCVPCQKINATFGKSYKNPIKLAPSCTTISSCWSRE